MPATSSRHARGVEGGTRTGVTQHHRDPHLARRPRCSPGTWQRWSIADVWRGRLPRQEEFGGFLISTTGRGASVGSRCR